MRRLLVALAPALVVGCAVVTGISDYDECTDCPSNEAGTGDTRPPPDAHQDGRADAADVSQGHDTTDAKADTAPDAKGG